MAASKSSIAVESLLYMFPQTDTEEHPQSHHPLQGILTRGLVVVELPIDNASHGAARYSPGTI